MSISGRIRNFFSAEPDPDPWKKNPDPHPCFHSISYTLNFTHLERVGVGKAGSIRGRANPADENLPPVYVLQMPNLKLKFNVTSVFNISIIEFMC